MVGMGFNREDVRETLVSQKYNDITATYLLLGRKNEVGGSHCLCFLALTVITAPFTLHVN